MKKAIKNAYSSFIYNKDFAKILPYLLNQRGIINIGGKKLSPIEVEDKIKEFDPELEAVCIGIPDLQGILGEV